MILTERHQQAINRLAGAYCEDFADYVTSHDRLHELMMELADEYIERQIPIVDEDAKYDLALQLMNLSYLKSHS